MHEVTAIAHFFVQPPIGLLGFDTLLPIRNCLKWLITFKLFVFVIITFLFGLLYFQVWLLFFFDSLRERQN